MRQAIQLGHVQETALVPLYARALESRKRRPILEDRKAAEMVDAIDWDFRRFGQRRRMVGCVLRCALFDAMVRDFLQRNPEGTVVEIGAGLNTRFERLDNGRVNWFDLDLPDMVEQRRRFFRDSPRHTTLAASVVERDWIATVRRSPGPYFVAAETVFIYLEEAHVKTALAQIAGGLPHVTVALDTAARRAVDAGNRDHARRKLAARFAWACDDPAAIQNWNIGLRLVESHTAAEAPDYLWSRLPLLLRANLRILRRFFPKLMGLYRLNVFAGE